MSDQSRNNYPDEFNIEATRRKKMEEFRRSADHSAIRGESDPDYSLDYDNGYGDDGYSVDNFATDDQEDEGRSQRRRKRNREINSFSDKDTEKRIERDSKKALKRQRKEEKKIEKSKAKRNRRIFKWVWITMIVLVAVVLSQYILVGVNDLLAISRESDEPTKVTVSIPADPTIDEISQILYKSNVINEPEFFKLYATFTSSEEGFRQGDFEIATNKDYEAIINFLQSNVNRTDIVTVQLTEGMSVLEIANTLHEKKVISDMQEFLDLCNDDVFDEDYSFLQEIKNADKRYYKLEGYLFPDTYDFYVGEDPKSVITKLLDNFDNKIVQHKEKYFTDSGKKTTLAEEIAKTDYTLDETLTIASIIQAEAASRDDMYIISSILHNRLEHGAEYDVAQLNCDCTIYYPYRKHSDVPESIRSTYHSNYNTNDFDGLPPGPICNPGVEAIKAAINPPETEYLYFCHDSTENGSTAYYSTNIYDHEYYLSIIEKDEDE